MKQLSTLTILLVSSAYASLFAQSKPLPFHANLDTCLVWDAGITFTEMAGRPARLFYGNIKVYADDRSALGLHFAGFMRRTGEDYGLNVGRPQLSYGEFGLVVSHQFIKHDRFMLGAEAVIGYASANIADLDQLETQTVFYSNDDLSYYSEEQVAKAIAHNHYFQYMPSLSASYRFTRHIGVLVAGGYNFLYGKTRFAHISDFNGWQAKTGLVFFIPSGR